ncbi:MAG: hypothetical protein R3E66_10435 [bacterium]
MNTVVTPPHMDMDEAALTRQLVANLQSQGYDARWGQGSQNVRCSVEPWGVEAQNAVLFRMQWLCEVSRKGAALSVDTAGVVFSNADAETFSSAAFAAAAQGLPDIAARIDTALQDPK